MPAKSEEKKFSETILRRHYENLGGVFSSASEKSKLIAKAVKAGKDSGLGWPKNKVAISEVLYSFLRGDEIEIEDDNPVEEDSDSPEVVQEQGDEGEEEISDADSPIDTDVQRTEESGQAG